MTTALWDYIVVGAGSAGCALTKELVDAGNSVLLLEAGGRDSSPTIKFPAGQLQAIAKHDWGYFAEADHTRKGKIERWPRGRVLGGSSSVNGTLYMRGAPHDYNDWAMPGWSWNDVLPLFKGIEASDQPGPTRGQAGSLRVRTVRRPHPLTSAFVEAAKTFGLSFIADYNSDIQNGIGFAQLSQRRGFRCSAADAFLRPISHKPNLSILTDSLVTKLEIANQHVTAICFEQCGRPRRELSKNVVLAAGAINSPHLLMLSGIGNAADLSSKNIKVVVDLPGVGMNLQDQPLVSVLYRTRIPSYNLTNGILQTLSYASRFLLHGEGPVSNIFEAIAFIKSNPQLTHPDLELIFSAMGYEKTSTGTYFLADSPSVTIHAVLPYPESRGRVKLKTDDPRDPPIIECPLLESLNDVAKLAGGLQIVSNIMASRPMRDLLLGDPLPGGYTTNPGSLENYVRSHTGTSFHPIGTCKMGVGPEAVVGPNLRVHGLENLWIADASVIPRHPNAATNAVCMMVGKKLGTQLATRSPGAM